MSFSDFSPENYCNEFMRGGWTEKMLFMGILAPGNIEMDIAIYLFNKDGLIERLSNLNID